MNEIVINFCPTGMIPTKEMTPYVPISPSEIIEQTHQAYEVGITIAHLHAREENGKPTWKPELYQEIFEGLRKYCPDLVICGSTSGRDFSEFEKRSAVIELKPDMCSLTLGSLNFMKQASINSPDMIVALAEKMKTFNVIPELECFDLGMINYGKYLKSKGVLEGPSYWNLLFGNIVGYQANFQQIGMAVSEIPNGDVIALAGLGDYQLNVTSSAIAMGYGVRIGIEDNIWFNKKQNELCSNIALVKRVHKQIKLVNRQWMKGSSFREKILVSKLEVE